MSRVAAATTVVMIIYFHHIFINIFFNFICFIIENSLYYLDCTCKLLRTILINLGYPELLFLLPFIQSLVYDDLFTILFLRLPMMLLLLLGLNCFVYCLDRLDLSLIEKLMNLSYQKLLLLAILLFVALSYSFDFYAWVFYLHLLCLAYA